MRTLIINVNNLIQEIKNLNLDIKFDSDGSAVDSLFKKLRKHNRYIETKDFVKITISNDEKTIVLVDKKQFSEVIKIDLKTNTFIHQKIKEFDNLLQKAKFGNLNEDEKIQYDCYYDEGIMFYLFDVQERFLKDIREDSISDSYYVSAIDFILEEYDKYKK